MTDREKISQQLSAYLDGELSDAEARRLEQAMQADQTLAAELRQLQAVRRMVADLPRRRAGEDFVASVLAQAERGDLAGAMGRPRAQQGPKLVRWLASAAVVLIAVGVGAIIMAVLNPDIWSSATGGPEAAPPGGQIARDVKDLPGGHGPQRLGDKKAGDVSVSLREETAGGPVAAKPQASEVLARPGAEPPLATPSPEAFGVAEAAPAKTNADVAEPGQAAKERLSVALAMALAPPAAGAAFRAGLPAPRPPAQSQPAAGLIERLSQAAGEVASYAAEGLPPANAEQDQAGEVTPVEAIPPGANRELILAGDLKAAQSRVEQILLSNRVPPLRQTTTAAAVEAQLAALQTGAQAGIAPNYVLLPTAAPADRVQYLAYVTPDQLASLAGELSAISAGGAKDELRERQLPAPPSMATRGTGMFTKPPHLPTQPAGEPKWIAVVEVNGRLQLKTTQPTAEPYRTDQGSSPQPALWGRPGAGPSLAEDKTAGYTQAPSTRRGEVRQTYDDRAGHAEAATQTQPATQAAGPGQAVRPLVITIQRLPASQPAP